MSEKYDAVVIGSGVGGLTCGAFLARAGKKVLVLEQHSKIGGYAHSFKRKQFSFESGIHSVPMAQGGLIMHLLGLLGVEKNLELIEHKEMFRFILPGLDYTIPARREDIFAKFAQDFPAERQGLERLKQSMQEIYDHMIGPAFNMEKEFLPDSTEFPRKYYNVAYSDFISSHIGDERLRNIFYSQWPYGGLVPSESATIFYALMFYVHCLEGSHFCKGGFAALATLLADCITGKGGIVRARSRVTRVECGEGMVSAVHLDSGESVTAPIFVSNISPYILHRQLIDEQARGGIWLRRLNNLKPSNSGVTVYLGLNKPVNAFLNEAITFWFGDRIDAVGANLRALKLAADDHLILLRPPEPESRSLQLLYFAYKSASDDWKAAKKEIADRMVKKACDMLPGLHESIEIIETGSPSTFERYTGNTDGAFYGFENTRDLYGEAKLPSTTYLKNLYQVGHWGKPGGGVWNVMLNGYVGAKTILKNHS